MGRWALCFARFSFDLQTFTLHRPIGRGPRLAAENTRVGHYPVAVLPGQYTDGYRRYGAVHQRLQEVQGSSTSTVTGGTGQYTDGYNRYALYTDGYRRYEAVH